MDAEGRDGSLPAATEAEEATKRNTDCVYFLASPLTCKKGVECEYRHSEGARMNPRDCWFWLNGICSNPKCAFRHPPLDGIIGTPGAGIPSQAPALRMPLPYPPACRNSNKQGILCYYFLKGACMMGDMCSFMHGPPEAKKSNHVSQQTPRVGVHDSISPQLVTPSCFVKAEQQNIPTVKSDHPVEVVPFSREPVCKAERFQGNGFAVKGDIQVDIENFTKSSSSILGSIGNTLSRAQTHHSEDTDEGLIDDGEADEFLHESSPGFDVLVDGDTADPTYFLGEEEYQDGSCYENNMNSSSDFERYNASDSDAATRYERRQYHEIAEYGQFMHSHDGQEFHEASTEGVISCPSMSNRRSRIAGTPTEIDGSDLRYQLLKKRKLRDSRSAISPDRKDTYRRDDRYARGNDGHGPRRGKGHIHSQGTVSKRLKGRISLPTRTTVANHHDLYRNQDFDRERSWGNSFSQKTTDRWGRFENRINWGKNHEDVLLEERKHVARSTRKDEDGLEFAGPKSLSELRGTKISGRQKQRSNEDSDCDIHSTVEKNIRSDKQPLDLENESCLFEGPKPDLENESCLFEGPKPLSTILKRKREVTLQGCTSADCDAKGLQGSDFMVSNPTDGEEQRHVQSSLESDTLEMEDPDFQNYAEDGEEEYDYEVDGGGEVAQKNDEDEEYDNTYQEDEEYVDGEDRDEFAQKLGVMYS